MKKSKSLALFSLIGVGFIFFLSNCNNAPEKKAEEATPPPASMISDPLQDKGIGPVKSISLGKIDQNMVETGKKIYSAKCTTCHNPTQKLIGPPQKDVLKRRSPEWVMNMILNTQEMLDKNDLAKGLLKEYNNVPMTNPGLKEEEARQVLEYFRTL